MHWAVFPVVVTVVLAPTLGFHPASALPPSHVNADSPEQSTGWKAKQDLTAKAERTEDLAAKAERTEDLAAKAERTEELAAKAERTEELAAKADSTEDLAANAQSTEDLAANAQSTEDLAANAETIEEFVEHVMACRSVPGLSMTVLWGDQVVLQRGFGRASLEQGTQVTADTPFCIGSCTKAFVATLIGVLLEENTESYPLQWDTRVVDILGLSFRFGDELRTQQATVKDLLAHKLGFPGYGACWLVGLDQLHTRQEYCSRLWNLEATRDFRVSYAYSNFMYLLSACVAERLGGAPFEALVRERILEPVGMERSHFISELEDLEAALPTAYIYNDTAGAVQELDSVLLRTVSPADSSGGLTSTAVDMARWLRLQLDQGRGGARAGQQQQEVVPEDVWRHTHTGHMQLNPFSRPVSKPTFPQSDLHSTYGLGWQLGSYRGYSFSQHSGSISAFESLVTVYRDVDLAIYTASNGPMYERDIHRVIHYYVADVMWGEAPWLDLDTGCTFPEPWGQRLAREEEGEPWGARLAQEEAGEPWGARLAQEEAGEPWSAAAQGTVGESPPGVMDRRKQEGELLTRHHERYVGVYGHLLFGNVTVSYDNASQQLSVQFGYLGSGELVSVTDALWLVDLTGPLEYYSKLGDYQGVYPPIAFVNEQEGLYQDIIGIAYEPEAPPVFHRGLLWTDVPETLD